MRISSLCLCCYPNRDRKKEKNFKEIIMVVKGNNTSSSTNLIKKNFRFMIHPLSLVVFGLYGLWWLYQKAIASPTQVEATLLLICDVLLVVVLITHCVIDWISSKYPHVYAVLCGMGILLMYLSTTPTDFLVALTCVLGLTVLTIFQGGRPKATA